MNPSWGQQVLLFMYSPAQCRWRASGPVSAHGMETLACSVYCSIVVAHESNKPECPYCVTLPTDVSPLSKEMMTFHLWTTTIFLVWITAAKFSTKRNYSNFSLFVINTVKIQMLLVNNTSSTKHVWWTAKCMVRALTVKCRNSHSKSRGVGVVGKLRVHTPSFIRLRLWP